MFSDEMITHSLTKSIIIHLPRHVIKLPVSFKVDQPQLPNTGNVSGLFK